MQELWVFLAGLFTSLAFMALLWCLYYYFLKNGGLVDIGWPITFIFSLIIALNLGYAPYLKKILLSILVLLWSVRLAWHLFDRFKVKVEDLRYTRLKEKWKGDKDGTKFLGLYLFQGVLAAFVALPIYLIATDRSQLGTLSLVGFTLSLLAFIGESVADSQLKEFKKTPFHQSRVCNQGLWAYSRHPNYFFEWLFWVGLFVFALDTSYGFIAIISPAIMYYLLRYLSGIPMLEAMMEHSRGDVWKAYKRDVPVFFPKIPGLPW